jgi:hypothetical protein
MRVASGNKTGVDDAHCHTGRRPSRLAALPETGASLRNCASLGGGSSIVRSGESKPELMILLLSGHQERRGKTKTAEPIREAICHSPAEILFGEFSRRIIAGNFRSRSRAP